MNHTIRPKEKLQSHRRRTCPLRRSHDISLSTVRKTIISSYKYTRTGFTEGGGRETGKARSLAASANSSVNKGSYHSHAAAASSVRTTLQIAAGAYTYHISRRCQF